MTSKYLGTSDKNARNDSRKQKQRKPKTKMRHYIDRITSQIVSNTFVTMAAASIMAEDRRQFCRDMISAAI